MAVDLYHYFRLDGSEYPTLASILALPYYQHPEPRVPAGYLVRDIEDGNWVKPATWDRVARAEEVAVDAGVINYERRGEYMSVRLLRVNGGPGCLPYASCDLGYGYGRAFIDLSVLRVRGIDSKSPGVRFDGPTPDIGGRHMAKKRATKRRVGVPGAKKKAAKKTSAKRKRTAKAKQQFKCLTECGKTTSRYFAPGMDARFHGWLRKIEKGEAKPKDLMPDSLVKGLGPWKKKGDGLVPSKHYKDLRPELSS